MGCHRSVVFGSPASLSGFRTIPVFGITLRGASCPKKVSKHLNSTFHLNIKEIKRGLIFLSPLHCIKKNTHPCKTLPLRIQKTGNAPRVLRHRGHSRAPLRYRSVSHSPFPPSFHSQTARVLRV